jgi:hypothetical protein
MFTVLKKYPQLEIVYEETKKTSNNPCNGCSDCGCGSGNTHVSNNLKQIKNIENSSPKSLK